MRLPKIDFALQILRPKKHVIDEETPFFYVLLLDQHQF